VSVTASGNQGEERIMGKAKYLTLQKNGLLVFRSEHPFEGKDDFILSDDR
jgi:hypothetical protein